MSDGDFQKFLNSVNSEVRDQSLGISESGDADFKENVFTGIVADYLVGAGVFEGAEVCHHEGRVGRGIGKANGYYLNEEKDRLEVFISVFLDADSRTTVPREAVIQAAQRARRFVDGCLGGLHRELEPASDIYSCAKQIHDSSTTIDHIRIHVFTDGVATRWDVDSTDLGGITNRLEIWDAERLFRISQAGLPRDEIVVDFVDRFGSAMPCLPMTNRPKDYMAYMAMVPGEVLYSLYDEFGSRLLELNVRSFLQARGKVNRGIRDSIRNEPDRFLAYNNGIVITADSIELTKLADGRPAISKMCGMQIVNGGQTTASIHRARKQDKSDISRILVPAKITVIESDHLESVVRHISLYANTQNVIQMADFSANDPFHVKIEQLSEAVWCPGEQGRWFYERARGQYQVAQARIGTTPARRRRFREQTPPGRKFTKPDLAKFVVSWDQLPHQVSRGAQKNFLLFMQEFLPRQGRGWEPDENWYRRLVAKAILFKAAQRIVRKEQFPAYRANITTYLVAYVSFRSGSNLDLEAIWNEQSLSPELESLMTDWSHHINDCIVETAEGRNVTEWAKKEECWKCVRALDLSVPEVLPPELRQGITPSGRRYKAGEDLTPQDYDNIAKCKQLDGKTWLSLYAWGKKTGLLLRWQCGIAQTLSTYAAEDWVRSPSPKQAKQGVKICEIAASHGEL